VADLEITYDPITIDPITVNSGPITVTLAGLDNIKVDEKFEVTKPIETSLSVPKFNTDSKVDTDSKFALSIPDPIKTDSKAAIDLQPVVLDQCLKFSLGPLPPTQICLPNRQRLGLTLFGVEVFGLTLEGEARVVVCDLPKPPHIIRVSAPDACAPDDPARHEQVRPHQVAGAGSGSRVTPEQPFVVRLPG
jgi:hypothetical protein